MAKRLSVPDDYFTLSQSLSIQHYDLKNYNTGLFTFGNGTSNNLSYSIGLSRDNTFNDPIYPLGGSSFSVTAKLSLPYSLFDDTDYEALREEREIQDDIVSDTTLDADVRTDAQARISEIDQERFRRFCAEQSQQKFIRKKKPNGFGLFLCDKCVPRL